MIVKHGNCKTEFNRNTVDVSFFVLLQIEDFVMISAKEAKDLLYTLFSENFITTTVSLCPVFGFPFRKVLKLKIFDIIDFYNYESDLLYKEKIRIHIYSLK